jgi:hypothetical protein
MITANLEQILVLSGHDHAPRLILAMIKPLLGSILAVIMLLSSWPSRKRSTWPAPRIGPMRFRATVELGGKTATGIEVPEDVVAAMGPGKRPPVLVSIGGHTYRTTVARMGGRFLVPLSAENRTAAAVAAGDDIDVDIEPDVAPREVEVPADLAEALAGDDAARTHFEAMSYTHRMEWVRWVEEAKKAETRATRLAKTVESLRAGKRAR